MYEKNKVLHDLALTYIYILFNQLEHFFLRKNSIDVHQDNVALYCQSKRKKTLLWPFLVYISSLFVNGTTECITIYQR